MWKIFFITLNENCIDDYLGQFTFISGSGTSVVDYILTTPEIVNQRLASFETKHTISSSHQLLKTILNISNCNTVGQDYNICIPERWSWDSAAKERFAVSCGDKIGVCEPYVNYAENDQNYNYICNILKLAARQTDLYHKPFIINPLKNRDPPWMNIVCKSLKKDTNIALKKFRKMNSLENKCMYITARNNYRKQIALSKKEYYNTQNALIENASNRQQFWSAVKKVNKKNSTQTQSIWKHGEITLQAYSIQLMNQIAMMMMK